MSAKQRDFNWPRAIAIGPSVSNKTAFQGKSFSSSHLAHDIENPRIFAELQLHLSMSVVDTEHGRPCWPRVFFSSLLRWHRHDLKRRYVLGALQMSCTSRFMIHNIPFSINRNPPACFLNFSWNRMFPNGNTGRIMVKHAV